MAKQSNVPPDMLMGEVFSITVRDHTFVFDLPRCGDIAEYCQKERSERIEKLKEMKDLMDPVQMRIAAVQMTGLSLEDEFRVLTTFDGQAWLVDRCFVRGNSHVAKDFKISDVLAVDETRQVWRALAIRTGMIDATDPTKQKDSKENEERDTSLGESSGQSSTDDKTFGK